MNSNFMILPSVLSFIIWILFASVGIYTLSLAIQALRIYIKKNS